MAKADKPLAELRRFARQLGWRNLRMRQHIVQRDGRLITWYVAGQAEGLRDDPFLQINECPIGQTASYTAAVYAIRYRICSGWHSMRLTPSGHCDDSEVERLDAWLHRRWFEALAGRRAYRAVHAECTGWSRARSRRERLPYEVVDAMNCLTGRTA